MTGLSARLSLRMLGTVRGAEEKRQAGREGGETRVVQTVKEQALCGGATS